MEPNSDVTGRRVWETFMDDADAYLNFGAGDPVEGWLNFDPSPLFLLPRAVHRTLSALGSSARSRRFLDAPYKWGRFARGRRLPFADGSLKAVYCSHVFEHLPADDIPPLLDEFHRILEPGGVLRVIVPDLMAAAEKALESTTPWVSLDDSLGTLPAEVTRSRLRAALEGLFGFPSLHKTLVLEHRVAEAVGDMWEVRTGLGYLESAIDGPRLERVESQDRCNAARVFELTRKP